MTIPRNLSFLAEGASSTGVLGVANGGTGLTTLTAGYIPYGNGTSALNSSSNLYFSGSNLGIGTSSPTSGFYLDVALGPIRSSTSVGSMGFEAGYSSGGGFVYVQAYNRNTSAFGILNLNNSITLDASFNAGLGITPSSWVSGDTIFQIKSGSSYGSLWGRNGSLRTIVNSYYDGANYKYASSSYTPATFQVENTGSFTWSTAPTGTAGNNVTFTQVMTLDNTGNLLLGKTTTSEATGVGFVFLPTAYSGTTPILGITSSSSTNATDTYHLYSTGAGNFRFYVDLAGTIHATSIVITAISDERLKENIKDIDTGLDAVMSLKPRRFDWKEGKGQDKKNAAGFIAQEYQKIFPDSVSTFKAGEDGIEYMTMNHEELIPTLVKAIQELNETVKLQSTIIAELQTKIGS